MNQPIGTSGTAVALANPWSVVPSLGNLDAYITAVNRLPMLTPATSAIRLVVRRACPSSLRMRSAASRIARRVAVARDWVGLRRSGEWWEDMGFPSRDVVIGASHPPPGYSLSMYGGERRVDSKRLVNSGLQAASDSLSHKLSLARFLLR